MQFPAFRAFVCGAFAQFTVNGTRDVGLHQVLRQYVDAPLLGHAQMEAATMEVGALVRVVRILNVRQTADVDPGQAGGVRAGVGRSNQLVASGADQELLTANDERALRCTGTGGGR